MKIKRVFEGGRVRGVLALHVSGRQNFSVKIVAKGMREGWLTCRDGRIIVHGVDGDLRYRILRIPGRYPTANGRDEVIHHYECELEV